ncbi:HAD-IIA family hydrolase [Solwaraspora sp. WMMD406]|uniref:HAD-IIA family hydrolase n=1 Tax=Solwaraspora sp. WMMD406 TaxID=3016095 RepID=UPI002416D585|nr:HAD-IIA family hydrolase [Solwaraspora sp. WMMD406]MDG4766395.1 HAD-IIA family hydrolase [Solwaraspora sp. WMMD406]
MTETFAGAGSAPAPVLDGLAAQHDLVIFDLDGVIYLIDQPIPGAVDAVGRLRTGGAAVAYATNNASRRAAQVAGLLTGMGVPAAVEEVLTSAGATAALLAERYPPGAKVLVVGADALHEEVAAVGLRPVATAQDGPSVVVQGYGPQVGWSDLAEASVAIRAGADWVATNTDRTLPSARGPLPGNGSLVAALRTALGRDPDEVVGKPSPGLFATAARRVGAVRPLVVGDRLDTDIEGANRAGMASLLVLTGISDAAELLTAPESRRPTYVAADLAGLFDPADGTPIASTDPVVSTAARWRVSRDGDGTTIELAGGGGTPSDALRTLCRSAWQGPTPISRVRAGSAQAEAVLRDLGLTERIAAG